MTGKKNSLLEYMKDSGCADAYPVMMAQLERERAAWQEQAASMKAALEQK